MIKRVFVEKKPEFSGMKEKYQSEWVNLLGIRTGDIRIFMRYDIEWDGQEPVFAGIVNSVLSEPPVDDVYFEELPELSGYEVFAVELLPGQFDQRADSCGQCIQLLTGGDKPAVRYACVYAVETDEESLHAIKKYIINPVEAREAALEKPASLDLEITEAPEEMPVEGFNALSRDGIIEYHREQGFAMNAEDLIVIQNYFKTQGREPNYIELKVADTYWSDHCRHTTFLTRLDEITVDSENPALAKALSEYRVAHNTLYGKREDKYACLMDIATIAGKYLSQQGLLSNVDISEEINACSIKVKADIDGAQEDWLVMFKNETHNHPTEIEPFGGAATCLGGAIRDPLSGRVYVYQAMRVSGSADIRTPIADTMEGKLPTRIISKTAASGFSSYGNQIGLATGTVAEITHPNYVAKRLETGFVVGAAPAKNVVRATPECGDIVLLIGGETGRDGCGGATGSSKAHSSESVSKCGAEVQKGNAPTERKIQRLFRNPAFTQCVKRCNDFGAGGVSVAIGELSEGLDIYLDRVPKKYEGLSALELAISESQERMAVVIPSACKDYVIKLAADENLNAEHVADITDTKRMRMLYNGRTVVDMGRDLLDSNGALALAKAEIRDRRIGYFENLDETTEKYLAENNFADALSYELSRPNVCINMGLSETFDSTIGAGTVLMPFGGDSFMTPSISMAAKLPVIKGDTDTATVAAWGYDPDLTSESPFVGSIYSVINSIAKAVATGARLDTIKLTLQEYFMKLGRDPKRWGVPTSALLGAFYTQLKLGIAAIGGKDSMSGSFERIDVPPTLISFALGIASAEKIITNVLSESGKTVYLMPLRRDSFGVPDFSYFKKMMTALDGEINAGNVDYATVVENGGAYAAVAKSLMGSKKLGIDFSAEDKSKFLPLYGNIIFSCEDISKFSGFDTEILGVTNDNGNLTFPATSLKNAAAAYSCVSTFTDVYPPVSSKDCGYAELLRFESTEIIKSSTKIAKPKVLIPVFPGTNCEYDTAKQFIKAGADAKILVFKNRTPSDIDDSIRAIIDNLKDTQILAFAGGFSAGDEPDGSGKFIAATYRNPRLADAVMGMLSRDGLAIGICNGFQALVKMGLLPFGKISELRSDSPTLTFNDISRHVSNISRVKITSNLSPWLAGAELGGEYLVPISHGEGKFVCNDTDLETLIANGQIFSQYVDDEGAAAVRSPFNPNGSQYAIEGITSADGRILGKMGHAERIGTNLYKNVKGNFDMKIFESGVKYFD